MNHADGLRKLQKFSEALDMKPLIEIKLKSGEDGTTVESVKFSFGMGPRIKRSLTGTDASGKSDSSPQPTNNVVPDTASPPVKPSASNAGPAEQAQSPAPVAQSAPRQSDGGSG